MAHYQKSVSVSGEWIKGKDIVSGTKAKLTAETNPMPSQFTNKDGSVKMQDASKIKVQGSTGEMNISINRASINALVDAFGEDSKQWIGKILTLITEKVSVGGQRKTALYLVPEGFEVGEDEGGYVVIKRVGEKVQADEPPAEIYEEEIKADQIPF